LNGTTTTMNDRGASALRRVSETVTAFADRHKMFAGVSRVTAAVSGGADSMAMLTVLTRIAPSLGFGVTAAHFDHRLRGAESDRDREFVESWCGGNGIQLDVGSGDTRAFALSEKLGTEDAARRLRYEFLEAVAETRGSVVATAHNADDNTETVLLNLARGAGARGLSGIPPVRGGIIRPMLTVARAEIETLLREENVPHTEDSSNGDESYARNKIRHSVMPVLRGVNPRVSEHTAELSESLREDEEFIASAARVEIAKLGITGESGGGTAFPASALYAMPRALAARVLRELSGVRLTRRAVDGITALCASKNGTKYLDVPEALVVRERDMLIFLPPRPKRRS
jgi:tRNA(Ile)-lysidine synthase